MDKLCTLAVLTVLVGCAASPPEPETLVASIVPSDTTALAQLLSTAAVVDVSDPENHVPTVCKPRVVTGSHLIRGVECTTPNPPELTGLDKLVADQKEWEIRELRRKQGEALERYQAEELRRSFARSR